MQVPKVPAGKKLVELILQCIQADRPLMLNGQHGVGKTELFKAAADALGVDHISRDLSIMEPTDFSGMPFIDDAGRTRFAAPAFLPTDGRGLFVMEEINRAPRYMTAPCLQLLTERRLNDVVLPPGWIPMASMNPSGDQYHVEPLDPALLSRFVQIEVVASVTEWVQWARESGHVHPRVIEFAENSPGIFAPGETNPRALTYLSHQVSAWEQGDTDDHEVLTLAAAGLVGETWAVTFRQFMMGGEAPFTVDQIIEDYPNRKDLFMEWIVNGKLDLVRASMHPFKRHLDDAEHYQHLVNNEQHHENARRFVSDLPADLKLEMRQWALIKGYDSLV